MYTRSSPERDVAEDMWSTCQAHGPGQDRNMFLPWHRLYVDYFERIIRKVSGDDAFTLPYWDYSSADLEIRGVLPAEFRTPDDPVFGSLFVENRNDGVNDGQPIQDGQIGDPLSTNALDQCSYGLGPADQGFCRALDRGLHGNVHVLVGDAENLGSVAWAANDPIFWLHHCNIDRLWASWNAAGRMNPALTGNFVFANENGQRVEGDVATTLDIVHMGYTYDRFESVPMCASTPTPDPEERAATRIAAVKLESPVRLTDAAVTVRLEPVADGQTLAARAEAVRTGNRKWQLVVGKLQTDAQPGVLYNVFLNLPSDATREQQKVHLVGTLNFFDAGGHGDAHDHADRADASSADETAVRFDVSELVKRQITERRLTEKPAVTIVPAGKPSAKAKPVVGEISLMER
jgi:tyrosinase